MKDKVRETPTKKAYSLIGLPGTLSDKGNNLKMTNVPYSSCFILDPSGKQNPLTLAVLCFPCHWNEFSFKNVLTDEKNMKYV